MYLSGAQSQPRGFALKITDRPAIFTLCTGHRKDGTIVHGEGRGAVSQFLGTGFFESKFSEILKNLIFYM